MHPQSVRLALACVALSLAPVAAAADSDPLERINRHVHALNLAVQRQVLSYLVDCYTNHVPAGIRGGLGNVMANLQEPVHAATAIAAGEGGTAANALMRFAINATLGWGGAVDAAARFGYDRRPYDLGVAACNWGLPPGPYLVLPLLGPSTLRDATAGLATSALLYQMLGGDILTPWTLGDGLVAYADVHPRLQQIEQLSLDGYAALRSVYLQRRAMACGISGGLDDDE